MPMRYADTRASPPINAGHCQADDALIDGRRPLRTEGLPAMAVPMALRLLATKSMTRPITP